jgi:hypothetical protein
MPLANFVEIESGPLLDADQGLEPMPINNQPRKPTRSCSRTSAAFVG